MLHKTRRLTTVILLLSLFLAGCTTKLPEEIPDIGIPQSEMNTRIRLIVGAGQSMTVKNKALLFVEVEVTSGDQVAFDRLFGVQLFTYADSQWTEIDNFVSIPEGNKKPIVLPPPEGWVVKTSAASISPNIGNLKKRVPVRVFVVGNLVKDGKITDERTAAFIDIMVKP